MQLNIQKLKTGETAVIARVIYEGHEISPQLEAHIALSDSQRLRVENPFIGLWTEVSTTLIVGAHSRLDIDLNPPSCLRDIWTLKPSIELNFLRIYIYEKN